jgi:CrcB protein
MAPENLRWRSQEATTLPLVFIALGGAGGAVARYLIDSWIAQRATGAFPWGTLVINVSGSLVLGLLFALATERDVLPSSVRAPLMIGFLGAYTTFSTLMLESWRLIEDGAVGLALANVVGSAVLGLSAIFIGLALGRVLA